MDSGRFDALTKYVARGASRRRTLASIATSLFASVVPVAGRQAAAACKKVGKNCEKSKDCCEKAKCKNGTCRCKDGYKNCDGTCKNLDTDEKHCGSCNTRCASGEKCCEGECADRQTNRDHCGACGNACAPTEDCVEGSCQPIAGSCLAGSSHCLEDEAVACPDAPECRCQQSVEGRTYCAEPVTANSFCGNCATSADCKDEFGPDAFCMITDGSKCCGPDQTRICRRPCTVTV
jgi:hypothetical protein